MRTNIEKAVYQPGDKLPTEKNLSARFNVNRHTIRNAIAVLKEEGLIRVDRGRGMFVAKTSIKYPIGERVRYNESLEAQGIKASYEKLKAIEIPAEGAIADALKIDIGAPVVLIERIGLANDLPISIGSSYFPAELFPHLIKFWDSYSSISKNCSKKNTNATTYVVLLQFAPVLLKKQMPDCYKYLQILQSY